MQLFSWRIGQAIAYAGGRITSTNTDGLYSVLESELNNKILAHEAESINVQIDPEPVYLISKDTNNRIEMDPENGNIVGASGGSLACRKGPSVTKSLTHPAAIDWALTEYLIVAALRYKNLSLSTDFDDATGMNILKSMHDKFEPVHLLRMFQNVIASSVGSINYIFGTTDDNPSKPIIMQHYNRVFIMKDGTPGTVHLHSANARVITAAQQKKRMKDNERARQHDPIAIQVLNANGVPINSISNNKEAVVKKVTNIEDTWFMYVCNKDLHYLSDDEINFILDNLDYDKYLTLLRDGFENNWRNHMPKNDKEPTIIPRPDNAEPDATTDTNSDEATVVPAAVADSESVSVKDVIMTETTNISGEAIETKTEQNYADESADIIAASPAESIIGMQNDMPNVEYENKSSTAETPDTEIAMQKSKNSDPLNIMELLDNTDIRHIIDTSKIALTSLDSKKAIFTIKTEDPEIVKRLCNLLY